MYNNLKLMLLWTYFIKVCVLNVFVFEQQCHSLVTAFGDKLLGQTESYLKFCALPITNQRFFGKISDSFEKSHFKKIVAGIKMWGKNIMKFDIVFIFSVTLKIWFTL